MEGLIKIIGHKNESWMPQIKSNFPYLSLNKIIARKFNDFFRTKEEERYISLSS